MADELLPVESGPTKPFAAAVGQRRPATGSEQERRIAWGKEAGAKVAAAYKQAQGSG